MLSVGSTLESKYRILKLLGEGGMSKVWLCENEKGERFAIKEIDKRTSAFKASQNEDKSLTEVEIIKELNHPLIPKVEEVYEDDESIKIVMELVEGLDLMSILAALKERGKRLEEEDIKRWAKELAEIFSYLHSRQDPIIYRDLKPSNIMINKEGDVRLLDFGIAKYKSQVKEPVEKKYAGTNGFASPEHKKGCPDESSDIFTLGRTLYFLAAGGIPSRLKKTTLKDGSVVTRKEYKPVPFSEIEGVGISLAFEKIIFRCMENAPEDRYGSASEILRDLMGLDKSKNKREIKEKSPLFKIIITITITAIFVFTIFFLLIRFLGGGDISLLPSI